MKAFFLALALGACAAVAANRAAKAERLYDEGLRLERSGRFAEAGALYSRAAALDPANPMYRLRSEAAGKAAAAQPPPLAPLSGVEPVNLGNGPALRALRPPPELEGEPARRDFDLHGDARTLFENVARAYALDCVFDVDYAPAPDLRFRIQSADFREALQSLGAATGSFVVPLASRLFLVAKDTPQKRREVEPWVAVTVALPQTTNVQEVTQIATAVQQAMALDKFGLDSQRNLVVIRGPLSKVTPARLLFEDLLQHHTEVALELQVIQASRQDIRKYGLTLPDDLPLTGIDAFTSVPVKLARLSRLGLGGWVLGVSVAQAEALAQFSEATGRSLLHVELRGTNGQPVTFHVGDRYPVLTSGYFGSSSTSTTTSSGTTTTFGSMTDPAAVAAGDFDGDGVLDLAVAAAGSAEVVRMTGKDDGTFKTGVAYATGSTPSAVATADFDGDGNLDLVTANAGSASLSVLLGNGDGTFQTATSVAVGSTPLALAVADFDGDGNPDIAVANSGSNTISVLLGKGDGTFQTQKIVTAGTTPRALLAADFNGDGVPDLAVANYGSDDLWIFLGKGDGTFRHYATYATGSAPAALAAGLLNTDSYLDLVVANSSSNTLSVFLGDGSGAFTLEGQFSTGTTPLSLRIADFNSDGLKDIAVADSGAATVALLLGLGTGSFETAITYPVGSGPHALAGGDFNSDGYQDLVVANYTAGDLSILLGYGNAGFHDSSGTTYTSSGGQSYSPYPSFNFEDLGLALKMTPHVHEMRSISLEIDAAVKSLTGQTVNTMPVITNRQLVSQIDLEDGQWAMVAGLLSRSDALEIGGIPGLSRLPGVGPLLRTNSRDRESNEVLILIRTRLLNLPAAESVTPEVRLGSEARPLIVN